LSLVTAVPTDDCEGPPAKITDALRRAALLPGQKGKMNTAASCSVLEILAVLMHLEQDDNSHTTALIPSPVTMMRMLFNAMKSDFSLVCFIPTAAGPRTSELYRQMTLTVVDWASLHRLYTSLSTHLRSISLLTVECEERSDIVICLKCLNHIHVFLTTKLKPIVHELLMHQLRSDVVLIE
jgi:hypothetical protein